MDTVAPVAAPPRTGWAARVQRRTIWVLVITQILSGLGMVVGMSVGALLVARIAGGPSLSGLAQSAVAVGGALLALPVARVMQARGRRPGLALAYLAAVAGAVLIIVAALLNSVLVALLGMFLFGGGTTANGQARYSATDLSTPNRRGRHLSLVIWATTIGAVAGPMLAAPADRVAAPFGLPELTGPFLFSLVAFMVAGLVLLVLLRPDPLLVARQLGDESPSRERVLPATDAGTVEPTLAAHPPAAGDPAPESAAPHPAAGGGPMARAFHEIIRRPQALLALFAIAAGHAVMLGVMVMTPIHIDTVVTAGHAGHAADGGQAEVLRLVGIVFSLHVAGMFAFSPLVGYAADRFGRRRILFTGAVLLLAACALAGTSGERHVQLSAGLWLLGLGWSCTLIAGSTLLTESVPEAVRPSAQGLSDLTMGLGGAAAGALSGVVVGYAGDPVLTAMAAAIAVPLLIAAWPRRLRAGAATVSG